MTDKTTYAKGFYEAKGMIRHVIILSKQHKEKMKELSKLYGITQGEVVEVMLDQYNESLAPAFKEKRESKFEGKISKTDLVKKLNAVSPEKLEAIRKILEGE